MNGRAPRSTSLLELWSPLGGVTVRPLLGGQAFFKDGTMFALLWQGAVFLRDDEAPPAEGPSPGQRHFVCTDRCGRPERLPYVQVPDELLDDGAEMRRRAEVALSAARSASSPPPLGTSRDR